MILSAVLMTDSIFLIYFLFVQPNRTNMFFFKMLPITAKNKNKLKLIKINHDIDVSIV